MSTLDVDISQYRKPTYPINDLFIKRWSPRALNGEKITREELLSLFEAARWAPSSYNNQPWRFIIAQRDTPEWQQLFSLMGEFNQSWTKNAAAIAVVISHNNFDYNGKPSPTHSFDTGAAWENLALAASQQGLIAHGMQGFDYERAKSELGVPEDYTVEAMLAIGKPGEKNNLPEELQKNEMPSDRKPLQEIIFKGKFGEQFV